MGFKGFNIPSIKRDIEKRRQRIAERLRLNKQDEAVIQVNEELLQTLDENGLPFAKRSGNVDDQAMTAAQRDRRGAAIAHAHAEKSGDPFLKAVAASQWKSQARYAEERLGIGGATMTDYRKGAYAIPRKLAEKIEKDLGIPADETSWPGGLVD